MKLSNATLLVVSWLLALAVLAGCSSSDDSSEPWEIAPFTSCTGGDECGDELSCVCGICTVRCQSGQDDCSTLGNNSTCTAGPSLGEACQAEVGDSEGVCTERCTSDEHCAALVGDFECRDGACLLSDDEPGPDGGVDGGDGVTTGPYDCEANDNCCSTEVEEMIGLSQDANLSGERTIGWEVHNDMELEPRTRLVGTWQGTRSLDATTAVACPANASQLGLPCQVDYVGLFRHKDGRLFEFRIALPRPVLDALPTDEAVEVDYDWFGDPSSSRHRIAMRSTSDSATLLIVGGQGAYDADTLELTYPDLTLRMSEGDPAEYETALCISHPDYCDRVLRAENLIIEGDESHQVDTGERLDFAAGDTTYRAWHAVSFRRIYGAWGGCADLTPPMSSFVIAPAP